MLVNILQVTYLLGLIVVLLVGTGLARLEFLFYGGHHNGRQYLRDLGAAILVSLLWPLALLFVLGLVLTDEWMQQARQRKKIEISLHESDQERKGMTYDDN